MDTKETVNNQEQILAEDTGKVLTPAALMWRKFKENRLAVAGGIIIIMIYLAIFMADFISPYSINERNYSYIHAIPNKIYFIDENGLSRPYTYKLEMKMDKETLRRYYEEDKSKKHYLRFFVKGESYRLFGLIRSNIHLFGVDKGAKIFLLGTDRFGRDMLSRILLGGRVSLSIGFIGVFISIVLGTVLGTISGYYGSTTDMIIQRFIEYIRSFPRIPLWMTLAAALPPTWSSLKVYFGIVTILGFLGWTGLARQIRGKVMAFTEEEYIHAAKAAGSSNWYIIYRHMIPNALSHIIVVATLAIPGMILGEASLSFLGLGIRPPMTSWGVLLQEAQNIRTLALQPWLLTPAILIIITILAFNFLGDGLRDAADPFST